ncbi:hypothetical protein Agub_g492 [Astrephomene gubernaculifera]|uniref:Uncharacterized protein n=1 Tax=Astrephomene gubernaculifera TaxID=47775 RepID=A0AAD3HGQ9_9CHLO|nr:hypothetical protein Agub_g492 [Astrephomene gubernaculifera]
MPSWLVPAAATAMVGVLAIIFQVGWELLQKLTNTRILWGQSMAETAQRFTDGIRGVREARFLFYGRILFCNRWYEGQQVLKSQHLLMRLGDSTGLRILGMFEQGIIWNNNLERWNSLRVVFHKAVQEGMQLGSSSPAKQRLAAMCQQAVQLTLREAREAQGNPDLLLVDLLDLLRCVTCRVTLALAFGLPVDSSPLRDTLALVHKVNDFFKAWEFFLLRPGHLLRLVRPGEYRAHRQALSSLRAAVEQLLVRATGGNWPPPGAVAANTAAARAAGSDADNGTAGCPSSSSPPYFLAELLRRLDKEGEERLSPSELVQLALEMLIAGTDTSSVTLYYALLALRDDPDLQQRVRGELAAMADGSSSCELSSLPLLKALLSESMRFKPVGPVVIRRANEDVDIRLMPEEAAGAAPEGAAGAGGGVLRVRRGDTVVVNLADMHRDPQVFRYPNTFDIRNFTEPPASATYGTSGHPMPSLDVGAGTTADRAFAPFGLGRKGCVGYLLALSEMSSIMWTLLRCVELPSREESLQAAAAAAAAAAEAGGVTAGGSSSSPSSRVAGGGCGGVGDALQQQVAPPLAQLVTHWDVANQPTDSHLVALRALAPAALPTAPRTPEVTKPPPRTTASPGGSSTLALGPSPPASFAWSLFLSLTTPLPRRLPAPRPRYRRVYMIGAGGVGKTTLLQAAEGALRELGYSVRKEVARQLLASARPAITRQQLEQDDSVFLNFQKSVIRRHHALDAQRVEDRVLQAAISWADIRARAAAAIAAAADGAGVMPTAGGEADGEKEAYEKEGYVVSDRSALDAVCYAMTRFGFESQQVKELINMREMQRLFGFYNNSCCLHILVPPFQRAPHNHHNHGSFQDAGSAAKDAAASHTALATQAGPAASPAAEAAAVAVEDDGVRIRSSLEGLWRYTEAAEQLMRWAGLPYRVLSPGTCSNDQQQQQEEGDEGGRTDVEARRAELLRILGGQMG